MPPLAHYLWAAPASLPGLALAAVALLAGAAAHRVDGVLDVTGGHMGRWARHCPFAGLTLGHVVLAQDIVCMASLRSHERVHVRQFERWGFVFLLAYPASSLWQWIHGRDPYRQNWFEREAYGDGSRPR